MFCSRNNILLLRSRRHRRCCCYRGGGGNIDADVATTLPLLHRSSHSSPPSSSSSSFLAWYSRNLDARPYLTKGLTSGLISLVGDAACQHLTATSAAAADADTDAAADRRSFDYSRSFRFFAVGAFWVAPIMNFWLNALNTRIVPGKARTVSRVAGRVAVDQFAFAPVFVNSFMAVLWTLENEKSPGEILDTLKEIGPGLVVANWSLWVPAMAINFSVVPLRYQVLYGNVVAVVWTVYLSWMSARTTAVVPSDASAATATASSEERQQQG